MTRIVSFSINGLAGRERTVQHALNEDVNVFWGANGSGKTSMLRILHSALRNDTSELKRVPFHSAEVSFYSEEFDQILTRTLSKSDIAESSKKIEYLVQEDGTELITRHENDDSSGSWNTTPTIENSSIPFLHQWLPITRVSEPAAFRVSSRRRRPGVQEELTDSDFDRIFAEGIVERWRHWTFQSSQQIQRAQEQGLTEVLEVALRGVKERDREIESLDAEKAFDLVSRFFGGKDSLTKFQFKSFDEFEGLYHEDTILPDIVQRIENVEERVKIAEAPQKRLEELIERLFQRSGTRIDFSREGVVAYAQGNKIPLGVLSSGQRQLLLILLESLRGDTSTIMVDEPELSMHVDWQQILVKSMRTINPNAQLIMATHSPEVMAELDDRCVIEL